MTMNDTWGYKAQDDNWKSTETLIRNLIDVASKGGNYLLNVGPKADGTIPPASVERLASMGRWIDVNGESVYLTSASPFDQPEWGRFTRRDPGTLYAHVFDWPSSGELEIPPVPVRIVEASLLTSDGDVALRFEHSDAGITVLLPEQAPDEMASVVRIEFEDAWKPAD